MTTLMYEILYGFVFAFMMCAAALIATLARKGIPKTFDREMYWTCFAASGLGAVLLIVAPARSLDWLLRWNFHFQECNENAL